jgi:hypothetical protein
MIAKISQKIFNQEEFSDASYWANKTMEERLEATCFLVEQYISMNNLPERMDKTVFEKVDKHKEWEEEEKNMGFVFRRRKTEIP